MKIDLDIFGLWYFLESCLRGSHLRSSHVKDFTDIYFKKLTPGERAFLYKSVLEKIHNGEFEPDSAMCGHDVWFMARYNPDNQYKVVLKDGYGEEQAFKKDGSYWVGERTKINNRFIVSVEKMDPVYE